MDIHTIKNANKSKKKKITKKKVLIHQKKHKQSIKQKQDNKKHIFYIVDCYVKEPEFLNNKYLYNHLVKAGLVPDKAMAIISRRYDVLLKKYKITKKELCLREKKLNH